MILDNIVDDDGEPIVFQPDSYKFEVYKELQLLLPNFNEYLFCEFKCDEEELPAIRFHPYNKKVLIWESGEKKVQQMYEIKQQFHHIFVNYYWDEENITSIPLGYFSSDDANYIPINERFFNISFIGALNRNRIPMAAQIIGISKYIIAFLLYLNAKKTLDIMNDWLDWIKPDERYFFSWEFNSGIGAEKYNRIMRHTKIALAPKGWMNTETYRMYEAMKYGCVVVTNELPKRKYYEDIPVIQVSDWEAGFKTIKTILKDNNMLNDLSEKNRIFYETYLSPKATAKIIAENLCLKETNAI